MSIATTSFLWQLSRPRTAADRSRAWRTSIGVAGSGALALSALAIITVPDSIPGSVTCDSGTAECVYSSGSGGPHAVGLAPYLVEGDLRGGTAFGALLLVVPFVLFALQALRTGTAARERRLAALSLAGATRKDLGRLALLEGTRAAVVGALQAGPAYLVLWLLLGYALPDGAKMLPEPGIPVWLGWIGLVVVMSLVGGLIARQAARPAAVSPLGLSRRRPRPLNQVDIVVPFLCLVLILIGFDLIRESDSRPGLLLILSAAVVLAISSGPWLVLLAARLAATRGNLLNSLAGRRLLADVRTPGRVAGVMLAVGISFGIMTVLAADVLNDDYNGEQGFYLVGTAAATGAAVLAAVVATSSLVVGASEQILDNARSTAVLVSLAASPKFVSRVVRRQLALSAVPATLVGALLGWIVYGALVLGEGGQGTEGAWRAVAAALPAALGGAALAAYIGVLVASRAVRPAILSSSGPENLRTP